MPDLTFAEAADWFANAADELDADVRRAETLTLTDLRTEAENLSSGPYSTKALRKMDHPYARRHGAPRLNPGIINSQTGAFRGAWKTDDPRDGGEDGLTSALYNDDPKATFLEQGTRAMFARPVDELIEERVAPRREARIERALDRLTS